MGDSIDHDASNAIIDGIDYSVAANAEAVDIRVSFELFSMDGAWSIGEPLNGVPDR